MRILREWIHRLRGTLLPGRRDADLEEELKLHVEMAAEDARGRGLDPADAERAARIKAGGASQAMDALRDQRGLPWLDDLTRDVRHGLRTLGASRSSVIGLVMKQGLQATVTGVVVGVAGAFGVNRMIASLLFGVQPTDAATIVVVIAMLTMVAAVACWLPAWRASRLDPNVVLRAD